MLFDENNHIVKRCVCGMNLEGQGKPEEALVVFTQAWNEAIDNSEKFIAAHYIARHQKTITDKLKWDETALNLALTVKDEKIKGAYPSLYLNIAKCYEDLNDFAKAKENYLFAQSYIKDLLDDGYGKMIRSGIEKGIERVTK